MDVKPPAWVRDAVFYQIFPDRFARSDSVEKPDNLEPWDAPPTYHGFKGGDLLGVVERLPYLEELGINALYLNPVFASAANHRYHTYDYYRIDPLLGGEPAFRAMLDAAHSRGMRVVLDGVFNHASRGFFQFHHLLEAGQKSPYIDWFHVHDWPVNAYRESERPNYAAWWGLHALPKFNTENQAVREYLWGVATHWLEQGIDGWRLDVPSEIDDDTFWQEFRRRCKAVNPDAYIVGELWGDATRWLQGNQFDAQMNYPFTRAALGFFGGDDLDQRESVHTGLGLIAPLTGTEFAGRLERLHQKYDQETVLSQLNMLSSHDTPRLYTITGEQVDAVRLLFLCQMTVAGAPNIYYGDEIGLPGNRDPDCRRAFPWHDRQRWNEELLSDVRRYVALRHALPALRRGSFSVVGRGEYTIAYHRRYEEQIVLVAFNASEQEQELAFAGPLPTTLRDALNSDGEPLRAGASSVRLEARSGRVWHNREV